MKKVFATLALAMVTLVIGLLLGVIPLSAQSRDNTDRYAYDTTTVSGRERYRILTNTLKNTSAPIYKLYKTKNMWIFLELNTCNGEVYKVQWTLDSKEYSRFSSYVGQVDNMGEVLFTDQYPGRFELYETTNIYNFILLDTYTGKTWQVQWGFKREDDFVIPILDDHLGYIRREM